MKFLSLLLLLVTTLSYGQLRPAQSQYYQERGALLNPSFENGLENWTLSGGCTASVTSDVPLLAKTLQVTCVAQTLSLKQEVAALADFVGQQGVVDVQIKTDVSAIKVSALVNGFKNAPVTVNASTGYQRVTNLPFVMGDTSSGIEIYSLTPITGTIYIDNVYVGFSPDGLIQTDYDDTPIGAVLAHTSETIPDGYRLANGDCLDKNEYNALFQIQGTAHGECDAGGGATSGFNLPDLRGKFVRGHDAGAGVDPDRGARTACSAGGNSGSSIGSCQGDAIRNLTGEFSFRNGPTTTEVKIGTTSGAFEVAGTAQFTSSFYLTHSFNTQNKVRLDASNVVPTGQDNRPMNVYLSYIVKVSGRLPENLYVKKSLSPDKAGFITWAAFDGDVEGHLVADGSCVDVNAWPDYVENVGSLYGDCDAGSGPLSGVRLPDIVTDNRFIRAAGGSISVGATQTSQNKYHRHDASDHPNLKRAGGISALSPTTPPNNHSAFGTSTTGTVLVQTTYDGNFSDQEARPNNIAMTPYIRMVDRDTVVARLKNGARVGDCKYSLLDEADFNSENSGNWVRLEGQSISGSDLDTKFGIASLPDAVSNGAFIRQVGGNSGSLRVFQDDQNESHNHNLGMDTFGVASSAVGLKAAGGGIVGFGTGLAIEYRTTNAESEAMIQPSGGNETRPKNIALNFYCMVSE